MKDRLREALRRELSRQADEGRLYFDHAREAWDTESGHPRWMLDGRVDVDALLASVLEAIGAGR